MLRFFKFRSPYDYYYSNALKNWNLPTSCCRVVLYLTTVFINAFLGLSMHLILFLKCLRVPSHLISNLNQYPFYIPAQTTSYEYNHPLQSYAPPILCIIKIFTFLPNVNTYLIYNVYVMYYFNFICITIAVVALCIEKIKLELAYWLNLKNFRN